MGRRGPKGMRAIRVVAAGFPAQGPLTRPEPSADTVLRTHLLLGSVFGPE